MLQRNKANLSRSALAATTALILGAGCAMAPAPESAPGPAPAPALAPASVPGTDDT